MAEWILIALALVALALATVWAGTTALAASYALSIVVLAVALAMLSRSWARSWGSVPKLYQTAWLSGALVVFISVWMVEEVGWWAWSIESRRTGVLAPDAAWAQAFQFSLSPMLKTGLAASAAMMVTVLHLIAAGRDPKAWAKPVRRVCATVLALGACIIAAARILAG